jgi:hypothetical protein
MKQIIAEQERALRIRKTTIILMAAAFVLVLAFVYRQKRKKLS